MHFDRHLPGLFAPILVAALLVSPASAGVQGEPILFTITFRGPSISQPASATGVLMTEGDILAPAQMPGPGPLPRPRIIATGGELGLNAYTSCLGHLPGTPCGIEVDALSRGWDAMLEPDGSNRPQPQVWFSVDNRGMGIVGMGAPPTVWSEGPTGDLPADVLIDLGLPSGPLPPPTVLPPFPPPAGSVAVFDGDGLAGAAGFRYPGLGLVEPNLPTGTPASTGDDLNGLDIGAPPAGVPSAIYFSLDAGFIDPLTGFANSGSAANQGASGASILRSANGVITVYATPQQLGLELITGDVDDVDALVLRENGNGTFQPASQPYAWLDGSRDMLIFSVRRGSSIIGRPDSIFGLPIEPGDLLVPPVLGGPPIGVGRPGIFIAAENLGLATVRSGTAVMGFGDDLDGADIVDLPCFDCNNNGIEDAVDIALGVSSDTNMNGIPDECEVIGAEYCHCPAPKGPCGNDDASAGCTNGTTLGARLSAIAGSGSVSLDNLVLRTINAPPNQPGIYYMGGTALEFPFGNGLRCVGSGGSGIRRFPPMSSGPGGVYELSSATLGAGIVATSQALFPPAGHITAGSTWYFQSWYRDPIGPCGAGFNYSNGQFVTFTP